MASRALSEPRNPHRPGPWGKQKCGPNRTLTLTDAGRETVRAYRAKLAAEAPGGWVRYTVRTMIGGTRVVWKRREVQMIQSGKRDGLTFWRPWDAPVTEILP